MKRVLLTGGAGFIGAHIVEHLHKNTDWEIVILDRLSYAGNLERLAQFRGDQRSKFVFHDFRGEFSASTLYSLGRIDYIIHNGAETHVDNSLIEPELFVQSNVIGTMNVLEAARKLNVERFILVSTDEVHGPAPAGVDFTEGAEIRPSNPYSASKASAEALSFAWWKSFDVPVIRTRTMNIFGERQHPEKFVPMCIRKILDGETVTIHGNRQQIGSRKWLHARNQADALLFLLKRGEVGETYHIAGVEKSNFEMASLIASAVGKKLDYRLLDFHSARPGHDLRYSLDDSKLRSLGWEPPVGFTDSIERTVEWTSRSENSMWLQGKENPMTYGYGFSDEIEERVLGD
jgi:dTDP-glucose 4,6-dehydratase